MDLIKIIALDTAHVYLGLYGLLVILTIVLTIYYGIERLVKWIGNKIIKHRNSKAVHE